MNTLPSQLLAELEQTKLAELGRKEQRTRWLATVIGPTSTTENRAFVQNWLRDAKQVAMITGYPIDRQLAAIRDWSISNSSMAEDLRVSQHEVATLHAELAELGTMLDKLSVGDEPSFVEKALNEYADRLEEEEEDSDGLRTPRNAEECLEIINAVLADDDGEMVFTPKVGKSTRRASGTDTHTGIRVSPKARSKEQ